MEFTSLEVWRFVELRHRTIAENNEKIKRGDIQVLTVEEMKALIESSSIRKAFEEVDVVTTATFGPMCSSEAFLNFGHSDPPNQNGESLA
jgi:uncharacterized protein (DUF39 family)